MRTWKSFSFSMIFVGALAGVAAAQDQTADQTQPQTGSFNGRSGHDG